VRAIVTPAAGLQGKVLAAAKAVSVRLLSHAVKAKKPSPLKVVVTSTMKVASPTSIAKMQTVKPWPQADRIVQEAIGHTAEAEIAEAVAAGPVGVVAVAHVIGAHAVAVVEIAGTAKTAH
jgi:hypothetical protein